VDGIYHTSIPINFSVILLQARPLLSSCERKNTAG
jgi:hypothetical protein